ncbi:hypothetical protein GCM10009623_13910 [Nocardioides aestuarii]|uniref:DUF3592 domain-containing protein n=1 Tax=Nocardioides aestuarii TaxID=252231 RepID=A0ABW4TJ01_9ACTN
MSGGAPGELRLHVQGTMLFSFVTPTVMLNHEFLPVKYGENVFPVLPGSHQLHIHTDWIWTYGKVRRPVEIRTGESVELWYAAPALTFLPGRLGVGKQRHAGLVGLVVFLVLVVALMVWLMTL